MRVITSTRLVLVGGLLAVGAFAIAGPLDPPVGPINPSFKTLTEIEPRNAVQSLPGTEEAQYVISQPGAYYLTGDIVAPAGKSAIVIATDHVTLDLGGFAIRGADSCLKGIQGFYNNVTVRNGNLRWCEAGGVDLAGQGCIIEDVYVEACGPSGIVAGVRSQLNNCVVHWCGVGFAANNASTLQSCQAYGNTIGFEVAPTSTLHSCLANGNNGDGFRDQNFSTTYTDCISSFNGGMGFNTQEHSAFVSCQAMGNSNSGFSATLGATFTGCSATRGFWHGFDAGQDALVQDCNAVENFGDGIRVTQTSSVKRCSVSRSHGEGSAGIHAAGASNVIEGCSVARSRRGIFVDASGNRLMRNTCSANTVNWDVANANYCLIVIGSPSGPINGNSGGVPSGATDPAANFTH